MVLIILPLSPAAYPINGEENLTAYRDSVRPEFRLVQEAPLLKLLNIKPSCPTA
jgi:hypothetical protein